MAEINEMREYAGSWILVSTVFLAFELTALTFILNYFLLKNFPIIHFVYLSCGSIFPLGGALLTFIAARDPRLRSEKYSIDKIIDIGVGLMFASILTTSCTVSYGFLKITHNEIFSIYIVVACLVALIIIYPVGYYKLLNHKKKFEDKSDK